MPTAIVTANTPQGFFLAAGGLARKETHGAFTVLSEKQQKVFEIRDESAHFAFAVTGTAAFSPDGEENIIFDFNTAIPKAANDLKEAVCADVTNYCQRLAKAVNKMLRDSVVAARADGKTVTCPTNPDPSNQGHSLIAMLFMCGYYFQRPYHVLFKFFHRNEAIAAPLIAHIFQVGEYTISGSNIVANLLYQTNDRRFSQFRHSLQNAEALTFLEWATIAKDYVAACESPDGLAADTQICPSIGGQVHAATVTTAHGFKWIPGFEPKS
jgi:hypothetical protein